MNTQIDIALRGFSKELKGEILFFLSDFLYHYEHDNQLEIPKRFLKKITGAQRIKLYDLMEEVKASPKKNLLFAQINDMVYGLYATSDADTKSEAAAILNELSDTGLGSYAALSLDSAYPKLDTHLQKALVAHEKPSVYKKKDKA